MTKVQRKVWLTSFIELDPVSFDEDAPALQLRPRKQRTFTARYYLHTTENVKVRVCRHAFMSVLGVGGSMLNALNEHNRRTRRTHPPVDGRGRHGHHRGIDPLLVARVENHILSFPRTGSRYALGDQVKYLDAGLSVKAMWRQYLKAYECEVYKALFPGSDDDDDEEEEADVDCSLIKPIIKYEFYLSRFNRFDLHFGKPVVDACADCSTFDLQIEACKNEAGGDGAESLVILKRNKRAHLVTADNAYKLIKAQKTQAAGHAPRRDAQARSSDVWEFMCSDMQGYPCGLIVCESRRLTCVLL